MIASLQEKLERDGETYAGQNLDLEESLIALCQSETGTEPLESLERILAQFHLTDKSEMSKHETATLKAFVRGVSFGFKGTVPWDSLNAFLVKRFPISLNKR